jgi:hypothetical protein
MLYMSRGSALCCHPRSIYNYLTMTVVILMISSQAWFHIIYSGAQQVVGARLPGNFVMVPRIFDSNYVYLSIFALLKIPTQKRLHHRTPHLINHLDTKIFV